MLEGARAVTEHVNIDVTTRITQVAHLSTSVVLLS